MSAACLSCGHAEAAHSVWWDASEDGGGSDFGCRDCYCDRFYVEGDVLPLKWIDCGGGVCAAWDFTCDSCGHAMATAEPPSEARTS